MDKKQAVMIERYVQPFVELVLEKKQEQSVFEDLTRIQQVFAETNLVAFLANIAVSKEEKSKALVLFQKSDTDLIGNLIALLIANDREDLFEAIVVRSLVELEKASNAFQVEIKSVEGLSEQQKARLKPIIEKKFGMTVRSFKEVLDADLIGGFIISANNKTIDASIRGQLQTMKEKMK